MEEAPLVLNPLPQPDPGSLSLWARAPWSSGVPQRPSGEERWQEGSSSDPGLVSGPHVRTARSTPRR